MIHQIRVPRLNANEDEVLLAELLVSVGDHVSVGAELGALESSKAAVSVEAEISGYVRWICGIPGTMVRVGSVLCLITDTLDEPLPELTRTEIGMGDARGQSVAERPGRITAKDRLRARRLADLQRQDAGARTLIPESSRLDVTPSHELGWVRGARALLEAVASDPATHEMRRYDRLPGVGTQDGYRAEGLHVGLEVTLASGAVIRARRLYVGDAVEIGEQCYIEADSVYIGPAVRIGGHTHIVSGEVILGEGVTVAEHVVVDLSGGRSTESRLLVGPGSLIASRALINTCREVVLEEETAISPGAMLFTHSFWQSILDGYTASFRGVRVCASSWVGAGCQVLPGVTVGPGSIIISNSTAVEDVPPFTLVAGVPAKVVRRRIRRELDHGQLVRLLRGILEEFARHLEFKGCGVSRMTNPEGYSIIFSDGNTRNLILWGGENPPANMASNAVVVALGGEMAIPDQGSVFNVSQKQFLGVEDPLAHELRNFLRRRGIRFRPFAWKFSFEKGL